MKTKYVNLSNKWSVAWLKAQWKFRSTILLLQGLDMTMKILFLTCKTEYLKVLFRALNISLETLNIK